VKGTAVDPGLGDGPAGDLVGVTRQVVDWLLRTEHWRSVVRRGNAVSGSEMSCCSPRNVIVATGERALFAARCESLPIGREDRSICRHAPTLFQGDLIETEGRDCKGT
jgi:hypothetical protein